MRLAGMTTTVGTGLERLLRPDLAAPMAALDGLHLRVDDVVAGSGGSLAG